MASGTDASMAYPQGPQAYASTQKALLTCGLVDKPFLRQIAVSGIFLQKLNWK